MLAPVDGIEEMRYVVVREEGRAVTDHLLRANNVTSILQPGGCHALLR